ERTQASTPSRNPLVTGPSQAARPSLTRSASWAKPWPTPTPLQDGRSMNARLRTALSLLALAWLCGCTKELGELGSEGNPVKIYFVPSVDAAALNENARLIKAYLEEKTPYKYKTAVPASYIAIVEAFGTNRADVAAINTFGYVLAHQKFGAQALLRFRRYGRDTFGAQIIARADGPIQTLEDIKGKKFAYQDPAPTHGYLMPPKLSEDKSVK